MVEFKLGKDFADYLDERDNLSEFQSDFYVPRGIIYMDGNSLGLMSRNAEKNIYRVMDEWKELAIKGWSDGSPPWLWFGEYLGEKFSLFVGADKKEVVAANSTTINIHNLISSFYKPEKGRKKILVDSLNFPTDIYAVAGQMRLQRVDPEIYLEMVQSKDGHTISEEDIIDAMDDNTAIVFLPSVLYRSGQLLNLKMITEEAHKRGILVGFDLAHSIGVIPHKLSEWGVDFAVWCSYKWFNGGPGGIAGLYINKKHFGIEPGLPGWWGHEKDTQFDMNTEFTSAGTAAAFQTGTVPMLSAAPVQGAAEIIEEAGIEKIREKSLHMTDYLFWLIDYRLREKPYNFSSPTPRTPERRGGHVAIQHPQEAYRINEALKGRGVIGDFRPPNIIRIAPSPLYNTYNDIWWTVQHLVEIIKKEKYLDYSPARGQVT